MGESYNFPICLSGEIGKHKGLKIPRSEMALWVQVPP